MTDRSGDALDLQVLIHSGHMHLTENTEHDAHVQVKHILRHVAHQLTRVEIHFHDINGPKHGVDKRVLIEARIRGKDPVTADCDAADWRLAVKGAAEKLERVLQSMFGKLEDKKR